MKAVDKMKKKVIVDLIDYRKQLYDAGLKNGELANMIYVQFFTIIMTTALAELAFLGTFELGRDNPSVLAAWSATLIVVSMTLMTYSMFRQKNDMSNGSKYFFDLSIRTDEYIKAKSQSIFKELPSELKINKTKLVASKHAKVLMMLSFSGILLASVLILLMIWGNTL